VSRILIVGAGPAGMAAAVTAAKSGAKVTLLDDNPRAGGQLWRGGDARTSVWFERLAHSGAQIVTGARVVSGDAGHLVVERAGLAEKLAYEKLILATGARELFLPFPGWTLPNVMGVGGLQALVKSGLPVKGKRVVVAGSGPLLLAVAAYLRKKGALVALIAEQASARALAKFTAGLLGHSAKLWQAISLNPVLSGIRYRTSCWIEAAHGSRQVEAVTLRGGERIACDYVANAFGFVPNLELAILLGRADNIYLAGEIRGIGGVDTALLEGQIAGYSASGQPSQAAKLEAALLKAKAFAARLNKTFEPRVELRGLANPDTIVCRCEDVTLARLQNANSWRSAKLHERCGMGPCQGRICGPAVQFILGWEPASVRQPIFPTRIENLILENEKK
jgi:NADPH-dependent 2,4-dienoyl-CoA reductase/sulfur reductase-like enzyme